MKTYHIKNQWSAHEYEVTLHKTSYLYGGGLSIIMNCEEGPYASLTVNIPGVTLDENEVVIDINNLPEAEDFIRNNNLGRFTGRYVVSGYCEYPIYKMNEDIYS